MAVSCGDESGRAQVCAMKGPSVGGLEFVARVRRRSECWHSSVRRRNRCRSSARQQSLEEPLGKEQITWLGGAPAAAPRCLAERLVATAGQQQSHRTHRTSQVEGAKSAMPLHWRRRRCRPVRSFSARQSRWRPIDLNCCKPDASAAPGGARANYASAAYACRVWLAAPPPNGTFACEINGGAASPRWNSMIDCASLRAAAASQQGTDYAHAIACDRSQLEACSNVLSRRTISPRVEPERRRPPVLLLLLLLLAMGAPKLVASIARAGSEPLAMPGAKAELWRELLARPLEPMLSGTEAAELLARTLAEWPDQRKAALLYLDLLSERKYQCVRPVSLAELTSGAAPAVANSSGQSAPNASERAATKFAWRMALDRITPNSRLARRLSARRLETGQLAQLALDNANLISRLLVTSGDSLENGDVDYVEAGEQREQHKSIFVRLFGRSKRSSGFWEPSSGSGASSGAGEPRTLLAQLSSPKFFKYLLESKARAQLAATASSGGGALHSLGLAFFSATEQREPSALSELVPFAPVAIIRRGNKRRWPPASVEMHELKLDEMASAATAPDALGISVSVDSNDHNDHAKEQAEKLAGQLAAWQVPSFLARWISANQSDELLGELQAGENSAIRALPKRTSLGNTSEQRVQQLTLSNGNWFSPHYDCGSSNRWLLTYSVPFFHTTPAGADASQANGNEQASSRRDAKQPQQRLKFRGVSFVQIDLAQTNLFNQCGRDAFSASAPAESAIKDTETDTHTHTEADSDYRDSAWFLASTHECSRIKASECIPLQRLADAARQHKEPLGDYDASIKDTDYLGQTKRSNDDDEEARSKLRSGAYVCACPAKAPHVSLAERQASGLTQSKLSAALLARSNYNASLELVVQLVGEREQRNSGQMAANERHRVAKWLRSWRASRKQATQEPKGHLQAQQQQQQQQQAYFVPGAQLEAEALLELMLTATATSDSMPQLEQQRRGCKLCLANEAAMELGQLRTECNQLELQNTSERFSASTLSPDSARRKFIRPAILGLQLACILSILALIAVVLRIRRSRIILISGWLMLETMLIGALLLYASVLVRTLQTTSLTCLLEPWLRELGFSVFYGSILIKLYRILTEFQTRKAHRFCLRDKDQALYLLAIILIVVGYMSAWTALMVDGFSMRSAATSPESEVAAGEPEVGDNQASGEHDQRQPPSAPRVDLQRRHSAALNISSGGGDDDNESMATPRAQRQAIVHDRARRQSDGGGGETLVGNTYQSLSAIEQAANEQLELLARGFNSFGRLFLGLLETEHYFDAQHDELVYFVRCRKLTWDYVTESSEMGLLLFGLHLVYKLRNATSEVHKEKLVLCLAVAFELFSSILVYGLRHALWHKLTSSDYLLLLYALRCQLTVSVTVAFVFAPKLYEMGTSLPRLIFGPLVACHLGAHSSSSSSALAAAATQGGRAGTAASSSVRHRCHISCEIHDHHLNDATRLHQAMLSSSALEIGSINLADMDPDEIQAELKRVYTQLEVLKTKAMRRDNPHISKRRGGRKPGHRKFSLQAFHGRHSSSTDQQHHQQAAVSVAAATAEHQSTSDSSLGAGQLAAGCDAQPVPVQQHGELLAATCAGRLPALAECAETPSSSSILVVDSASSWTPHGGNGERVRGHAQRQQEQIHGSREARRAAPQLINGKGAKQRAQLAAMSETAASPHLASVDILNDDEARGLQQLQSDKATDQGQQKVAATAPSLKGSRRGEQF